MSVDNRLLIIACLVCGCLGQCDRRASGGELKCCEGKNSDCYVQLPSNSTEALERHVCYCDTHCQFTDDCCPDARAARRHCQADKQCRVTPWSAWSGCSAACGVGVMRRRRNLIELPSLGGHPCPSMTQVRGCNQNMRCDSQRYEPAFILPITFRRPVFGEWLYEKILPAARTVQNDHAASMAATQNAPTYSYCVNFKLMFKKAGCANTWAKSMHSDVPICTECQSRVMDGGHCRGEGAVGIRTRWKALGVELCYGDWIRLGPVIPNCTCSENFFSNFVFV